MGDTVAILPELSFRQQVIDLATHISRSLPTASDANASREYIASVESSLGEGEDVEEAKRVEVVKALVTKVGEARGALEGAKESDVELSHLLLQNIISTTLQSTEFESAVRSVVEAIRKGAEANLNAGRMARVEVAARIINNIYNALPPSSPRPFVLLALLNLLTRFTDLSVLPITATQIRSISSSSEWLRAVSDVYAQAGQYGLAADIVGGERGVVLSVCDDKRFEFEAQQGEAGGLVKVLRGEEEVGAWVGKNGSWIEAQGIPKFTPTLITHKAHLLALARLFASSPTRSLSFSSIASSLSVSEDEVDEYIFDGSAAGLFEARINQTTASVKVISVSRAATTTNQGKGFEWDLLAQRLGEWKKAVGEARRVVGEAEAVAAQPVREQRDGRDGRDNRDGREKREYKKKEQVQSQEEIAA